MTGPSKKDLDRRLGRLEPGADGDGATVPEFLWADLLDHYDGDLTPGQRRLLDGPETHLTESARERLEAWTDSESR